MKPVLATALLIGLCSSITLAMNHGPGGKGGGSCLKAVCPGEKEGKTCGVAGAGTCKDDTITLDDGSKCDIKKCECNEGYVNVGRGCKAKNQIGNADKDRQKGFDAEKKRENEDKAEKETCWKDKKPKHANNGTLCPSTPDFAVGMQGRCAPSIKDCFDKNTTLLDAYKRKKESHCGSTEKFCDKGASCVPTEKPCPSVKHECKRETPFRCQSDWTCQASEQDCPANSQCTSAGKKTLCPDGLTCEKDMKECGKRMTWDGCPAGHMECPQMEGACAKNATMCVKRTGCAIDKFFCSHKRDVDGKIEIDPETKRPVAVCADAMNPDTCKGKKPGKGREPESISKAMKPKKGEKMEARDPDGRVAAALQLLLENAFVAADGSGADVNFTIGPVPDSIVQTGGLSTYYDGGAIMSAVLLIEPSKEIIVRDGLLLQLPVDALKSTCDSVVANLAVLTVHDVNDLDATPEIVSKCRANWMTDTCFCDVNVTAFSAFAAIDAIIADEGSEPLYNVDDLLGSSGRALPSLFAAGFAALVAVNFAGALRY